MSPRRRLPARGAARGPLLAAAGAALLLLALALGEGAAPQPLACDATPAAPHEAGAAAASPAPREAAVGPAGEAAAPARLVWLGDTLLADAAQRLLEGEGYAAPFAQLAGLLDGDHVIANLEGPLTERTEVYARRGRWSYNAQPRAAAALAEAGVTIAGLANNHAMDRGPLGLADTLAALARAGIAPLGAGPDREAALRPLLLPTAHGVVALGDHYGLARTAGEEQPGGAAFAPCDVVETAARARSEGARWLVAFVHWGANYSEVRDRQRVLAGFFAESGYDLVVGHGPHVAQPIEVVDGMPVLHSLGNFVFGTPGRFSERFPGYGLVATTVLDGRGLVELRLRCLLVDNDRVAFRPRPCPEQEAHAVLHPRMRVVGGEDVLSLR